jgi:hypothetical protein
MATDVINSGQEPVIYSGSQLMGFGIAQMPPNLRIYVYCNGINISQFCAPTTTGASMGDPIYTDQIGAAAGYIYIPSSGIYQFPIGEMALTFSDSNTGVENSRYISEATFMNHGDRPVTVEQSGTLSLRTSQKLRASPTGALISDNKTINRLDPLAQSFIVDSARYPLGLYLTSINLFFLYKDPVLPIGLEIRPMVNGKPSQTEYMSGSYTQLEPLNVNLYNSAIGSAPVTKFTFAHPLFLRPGEYAFCILTKSDKYFLLSAKNGEGTTVKQPFAGTLFKAQNVGDWVGTENEDLTFQIVKAKFNTGTVTYDATNFASIPVEFNKFRLLSTAVTFGDISSANYAVSVKTAGSGARSDYLPTTPGVNLPLPNRKTVGAEGDLKVRMSLTNKSSDISPMLDNQLIKAQILANNITDYTQQISDSELSAYNGSAKARYIGSVVSLADNFDSTGLQISVDVMRPPGADIEVFCRVLARGDKTLNLGIKERPWIRMPLVQPAAKTYAGIDENKFSTEIYKILEPNLNYTSNTDITSGLTVNYDTFASYQIKVVFYASNSNFVPMIRNLSATSVF